MEDPDTMQVFYIIRLDSGSCCPAADPDSLENIDTGDAMPRIYR